MAFLGKDIRTKIVVDNNIIEQLSYFNYLGCNVSYVYDKNVQTTIS